MITSAIERRLQPYLSPLWLQARQVKRRRRALDRSPVCFAGTERRLFVDLSIICKDDAGTGIQRVVRGIGAQLVQGQPENWKVQAVNATRHRPYHAIAWPLKRMESADEITFEGRPGDVFLGLDFALDSVRRHEQQLVQFKRQGGEIWFVVHDFLPIQKPEWFSDQAVVRYRKWLRVIASLADGFFCNSEQTQKELCEEILPRYGVRTGIESKVLPMGWDLATSRRNQGLPVGFEKLLAQIELRPTVLMVGTVEPRKGYEDALTAFDVLWKKDFHCNLVIVGRPGWKTTDLQSRLRNHPLQNTNLYWLDDASDEALQKLYMACDGVMIASRAEGFGLTFIEALGYGKPLLVRDLPVFRHHQGSGVWFFAAAARPEELADAIEQWIGGSISKPDEAGSCTASSWSDAARVIFSALSFRC